MNKLLRISLLVGATMFAGGGAYALPITLEHTFDDPTTAALFSSDNFGSLVALDGNSALIGVPFDDTNGTNVGQAHLFDATTGNLLQTFDDPTPTFFDNFGKSVALDGDNVLIGAPLDDTDGPDFGQAHLFDLTTGNLLQTFNDPSPPTLGSFAPFGSTLAIDGDNVLVGDVSGGQVYLFDASTGGLLRTFETPPNSGSFGSSIAVAGNTLLIGASSSPAPGTFPGVGAAFLFDITTGALLRRLDDPNPTGPAGGNQILFRDAFGAAVAFSGNLALIGAPGDGTNATDAGQAHLFDATTGSLLHTFNDPMPTFQDSFGSSVALDGNNVLIGAGGDDLSGLGRLGLNVGSAFLFDAVTGDLLASIDAPSITDQDGFGTSLAIRGDNILIGAPSNDLQTAVVTNIGQAYLFSGATGGTSDPPVSVSEPATLSMFLAGLVGVAGLGIRRRRSDAGAARRLA